MSGNNKALSAAKNAKKDEFYTQYDDIEKELIHYKDHFYGKVVYCNCDTPNSNFVKFFENNFQDFGLKGLIHTSIQEGIDFRSDESIKLLKQSDIIVTNPPFSLFREYVAQLVQYDKKFLIIGNYNAITYKEIFPLLKDNKIWLGYGFAHGNAYFSVPNDDTDRYATGVYNSETGLVKFRNCCWFTNMEHNKRHEKIDLVERYYGQLGTPEKHPKYDNYDAIEVSKVVEIPKDYEGVMGVPITFMDKYNPEQFELLGITDGQNSSGLRMKKYTAQDSPKYSGLNVRGTLWVNRELKSTYARLLIRNRHPEPRQGDNECK